MKNQRPTVAEYAVARLADLGIKHVFGVPGDYSFPIDNAIERNDKLSYVACSNELNAAYFLPDRSRVSACRRNWKHCWLPPEFLMPRLVWTSP